MANFGNVLVTEVATRILSPNDVYRPVWINTVANTTVYIGDNNTVTTANGLPVEKNNVPLYGELSPGQELWAICAAGTTENLRYFSHVD